MVTITALLVATIKFNFRIKETLESLPTENAKTVFQHTPLYLEDVNEEHASDNRKSLEPEHRMFLLELYDAANVDHVFSGVG